MPLWRVGCVSGTVTQAKQRAASAAAWRVRRGGVAVGRSGDAGHWSMLGCGFRAFGCAVLACVASGLRSGSLAGTSGLPGLGRADADGTRLAGENVARGGCHFERAGL